MSETGKYILNTQAFQEAELIALEIPEVPYSMIYQDKVMKALLNCEGNESASYPVFRSIPILHTILLEMDSLIHSDSILA